MQVNHRILWSQIAVCIWLGIGLTGAILKSEGERMGNLPSFVDVNGDAGIGEFVSTTSTTIENIAASDSPKRKKLSKKSKISLPADYDKLQVPNLKNVNWEAAIKNMPESMQDTIASLGEYVDLASIFSSKSDEPLMLQIDVKVRNVRSVDEIKEEITVELDFIAMWLDYILFMENDYGVDLLSLASQNITENLKSLDPSFLNKIWKPDLFIEKVLSISRPELIAKPVRLLYAPAGSIIFSTRVAVRMNCAMEFHYYPADTQSCIFQIRSYSYTTKDLDIKWNEPGPSLLNRNEHNFDIKLDVLKSYDLVESDRLLDTNYSETYRVLQFKISGRRKLSFHLIQTFMPSAFLIVITWLSFLLPSSMVEARIGINMTTLLTLTAMFASIRENAPTVSYVKAIDVWMVVCIFFVFLTLFQFTFLTWRRNLKPAAPIEKEREALTIQIKEKNIDTESQDAVTPVTTDSVTDACLHTRIRKLYQKQKPVSWIFVKLKSLEENDIETHGFRAFSSLFIIFNLIFWPWLLLASQYYNWDVNKLYNA